MSIQSRPQLGQLLLERALISAKALHAGLAAHQQHGPRLGSALVQLGLLDFDALAQSLSLQLGFPPADSRTLDRIEPRALAAIPAQLRSKYQVLPLRLDGRCLHLAAVDPQRDELIGHLASALRVQIRPYIVPQGLLAAYLSRAELGGSTSAAGSKGVSGEEAPDELLDLVYLDEVTGAEPVPGRRSTSEPQLDIDISFEAEPEDSKQLGLDQLLDRLDRAERTDDVVGALLQSPVPARTLSVLFLLRGESASALGAWGSALAQSEVRTLVVPLNMPSLLKRAFVERRLTVGETREDNIQSMISTFLRAAPATVGLATPICLGERVVNLLYVQVAEPVADAALDDINALARRAAETYGRLISTKRG